MPLNNITNISPQANVTITQSKPRSDYKKLQFDGVGCQWQPEIWHMHIPGIGHFLCRDGSNIEIYPEPEANNDDLTCFLLGPVINALLIQRKKLLLHGCVIAYDQQHAFAILNSDQEENACMSYQAQSLGWTPLSDDTILPNIQAGPKVSVTPGAPWVKLWEKTCRALKLDTTGLNSVRPKMKHYYTPINNPTTSRCILTHIFELVSTRIDPGKIRVQQGLSAFRLLQRHTIGTPWLKGMQRQASNFTSLTQLANIVPTTRIQYRKDQPTIEVLKSLQPHLNRQREHHLE